MGMLRHPRLWMPLLLLISATVALAAVMGTWFPLLATAPWLGAIVWFGAQDGLSDIDEPPSAAEAARQRLWAR